MALHKHEPVSESDMDVSTDKGYTICQVLRDIYHRTESKEIKLKLRVATAMAKAMAKKLSGYKEEWEKEFYDQKV